MSTEPSIKWHSITGWEKLDSLIRGRHGPFLLFGEAGTGKTTLLLTMVSNIVSNGGRALYIATEGSSSYAPRLERLVLKDKVIVAEISDFREQEKLLTTRIAIIADSFDIIGVDSINYLYRLEDFQEETIASLALQMSVLYSLAKDRRKIIVVTGQVHGGSETEASGMWLLSFWSSIVGELERLENGLRRIRLLKPIKAEAIYKITGKGVEWR